MVMRFREVGIIYIVYKLRIRSGEKRGGGCMRKGTRLLVVFSDPIVLHDARTPGIILVGWSCRIPLLRRASTTYYLPVLLLLLSVFFLLLSPTSWHFTRVSSEEFFALVYVLYVNIKGIKICLLCVQSR